MDTEYKTSPTGFDMDNEFKTIKNARERRKEGRFEPGDTILKRYKIISELGQGGMGVVYKCFDEVAGIEVALKAIPPELSHNSFEMEEIRDNFQLVAKLIHQNIAASRNLERDELNGNFYLIMEYCAGEDLRHTLRRQRHNGTLNYNTIIPIIRQIADALDYAHKQMVIHRDIKPGNIIIAPDGTVKILDFGLAAQMHSSLSRTSMAYRGTSGTGPYMAPEQWRGRAQGPAADQYALAVMTYEMFAGHLPFDNPDPAVLQQAVLTQTPEKLINLPPHVNAAIIRGMSKNEPERFESCSDFARALAGEIPASAADKRSAKILLPAVIAAAVILLIAGAVCYFLPRPAEKSPEKNSVDQVPVKKVPQMSETEIFQLASALDMQIKTFKADKADQIHEFASRWQELILNYESGIRALNANRLAVAGECLQKAQSSAKWFSSNITLRRKAQNLDIQLIKARKTADSFDAVQNSRVEYLQAEQKFVSGKNSFDNGYFDAAIKAWQEALTHYTQAGNNARDRQVENLLREAANAGNDWKKIKICAEKVLKIQPENSRAQQFLADANKNLIPKAVVKRDPAVECATGDKYHSEKNYTEAVKWYRKAADLNFALAQYNLGNCYYYGRGVEKDHNEAENWYRKAAGENADARNALARLQKMRSLKLDADKNYQTAEKFYNEQNYTEALKYYRLAADGGNSGALNGIGWCYQNGYGVTQDYTSAMNYYRQGAALNNPSAINNIGYLYANGLGVTKDYAEAVKWYRKSAELGNAVAQSNLGDCYDRGNGVPQDCHEAVKWYRKAAEKGNSTAQNNLAVCYDEGQGVTQNYAEAVKWYRKSAEKGNSAGQFGLANCYYNGNGVEKNYTEAVKWFNKSALQNHHSAQNMLGICYYEGKGVVKNFATAVHYFRLAAEGGHAAAQNNLGECYRDGEGVPIDRAYAVFWIKRSARQGFEKAKDNLKKLGE